MIIKILKQRLAPVIEAERTLQRHRVTSVAIGIAGALGFGLWLANRLTGFGGPGLVLLWVVVSLLFLLAVWNWLRRREVDLKALAQSLEARFPELDGRLLTALEVDAREKGSGPGYLEERVIVEAVDHSAHHFWDRDYRRKPRNWATAFQTLALIGFSLVAVLLSSIKPGDLQMAGKTQAEAGGTPAARVELLPGNTEVEKGTKLVVEARFEGAVPNDAVLEMISPATREVVDRLAMQRNLDDPVFGSVVPRIDEPVQYRVAFAGTTSETYDVGVYVHPKLEQADATVTPPAYTEQEPVTVKDVRAVTVLEGSEIAFAFKLNKPVRAAELFGEDETIVPLETDPEDPARLVTKFHPDAGRKYRLHLVDAEDRANKEPPWFTIKLKQNLPPKLELVFPGKDSEVSPLEEMALEGKVWDDLGVARVGASVSVGGKSADLVFNKAKLAGRKEHDFGTILALEDYEAEPAQLVSYHFWAEDIGPDGKPRRTESDLFFAEVRHWDHIFREGTPQEGQGKGQSSQSGELRKQQKEIINATWKLMRRTETAGIARQLDDADIVRQSQEIVMRNVNQIIGETGDADLLTILTGAKEEMEKAVSFLHWVVENTDEGRMPNALAAEKAAYQQLLKAESRETEVTASKSASSQGQSQPRQKQLMQLELKQSEARYETETQAEEDKPESEQAENLAILARLKELARREEALAEKIKEIEAALKEAKPQEEQAELENQLKRLREEQEAMLRDLDELMEKMDSQENSARLAEERQKLSETREQVQQANEQLKNDELAQAANSATRAQRELKAIQEEFRKRTSSQFSEEMKEMRQQARELAESQDQIGETFENAPDANRPFQAEDAEFDNQEVVRALHEQKTRLEDLLENMRQVSEQAEASEPVLSGELYETVRQARTAGIDEALDEASALTRYGRPNRAQQPEREAGRAIEQLKEGIEKAAEAILGDEAQALRMARNELDRVIDQLEQERNRRTGEGEPSQEPEEGQQPGPGEKPSQMAGNNPPGSSGQGRASSQQPGQPPQPSQRQTAQSGNSGGGGDGANFLAGDDRIDHPGPASNATAPPLFFEQIEDARDPGPIMGEDWGQFADSLRKVEEILDEPQLRSEASKVLDRARAMRMDYRSNDSAPRWDLVQTRIVNPLVELRSRVSEQLARKEKDTPLVPIDRDPVPGPYRDLVRKYYEKLASGE